MGMCINLFVHIYQMTRNKAEVTANILIFKEVNNVPQLMTDNAVGGDRSMVLIWK